MIQLTQQDASSEKDRSPEMLMVKEDVVEAVLQALERRTSVLEVARDDAEPLWTSEQAARYLGVSLRYLRDTDCPRVRLPGRGPRRQPLIRFVPSNVREWARKFGTDRAA